MPRHPLGLESSVLKLLRRLDTAFYFFGTLITGE
jgi:hypothetical protein